MKSKGSILLVEDDKVDQLSVKRALKEVRVTNELLIASNGEEALEILEKQQISPTMILLDLNMPKMNGMDFLRKIKKDADLSAIPVIVLTTSNTEIERNEAYRLGVCGFIIKPVEFPDFIEIFKAINNFWNWSEFPNMELE